MVGRSGYSGIRTSTKSGSLVYEGYWPDEVRLADAPRAFLHSMVADGAVRGTDRVAQPARSKETMEQDFEYVASKLDLSVAELRALQGGPNKSYRDYRNSMAMITLGTQVLRALGLQQAIIR
jgi:hypothetical protein